MRKKKLKFFKGFDNSSSKRVSFIVATKNRAKFLEKMLINASFFVKDEDELIVIDGGGDSETLKVVRKYSPIISIFLSEPDLSTVHGANKAIMLSTGKYIKTLNDDDYIYPEAMEKAIATMDKNNEIEVILCGGEVFHKDTKATGISYLSPGNNYGKKPEDVFLYGGSAIGLLIKRSVFAKIGLFPMTLISDAEFVVNCIRSKVNVKFCRLKLYKATVYKHSVISSKQKECELEINNLVKDSTPLSFYLKYKINRFIWRYNFLNQTTIRIMNLKKQMFNKNDKLGLSSYIWDGGFS